MDKEYLCFIKDAYSNGLCDEYRDEIRRCHEDKLSLVRLAMRQQSIPYIATKMHEGVITKDYVQKAFSGFLNGFILKDCDGVDGYSYTWYVGYDSPKGIIADVDVLHVSFTKDAIISVPTSKATTLYVSNGSDVHIVCDGYNHIQLYLFDDSRVTIDDADMASNILIYRYCNNAVVEAGKYCFLKPKIFDKELRL